MAVEALKDVKTIEQIGNDFEIHPMQASEWKTITSEGAPMVFQSGRAKSEAEDFEAERTKRHSKLGQLAVEVVFLTKTSRQRGL